MGKLYRCINCEQQDIHDRQRHHYEKHLELPYSEKFFKPVCDYKNISKIKCLLCGYIIESDQYRRKMQIHGQIFHPETKILTKIFNPTTALRCIAIKCSICERFIEKDRLNSIPKCPHGSLYDDPNDASAKRTENEQPNETRKRNATNGISEREFKIFKESVGMEASSTTIERESSDEGFTICNVCHIKIKTSALEKHMGRKHLEKAIVLDSDSEQDEKPIIKVEKNVGHSTVAILDSDNKHTNRPKIKVEKNAGHSTVATVKPLPKETPSIESNERSNAAQNDSDTEFYALRISKSELERFLLAKRIYPKNGNFYLKDS